MAWRLTGESSRAAKAASWRSTTAGPCAFSVSGELVDYPPESGQLYVEKSLVGAELTYSRGEKLRYWFEGRISANRQVTMLYWKPTRNDIRHAVGVVFLGVRSEFGKPLRLEGSWTGCTRTGQVESGRCTWTRLDAAAAKPDP